MSSKIEWVGRHIEVAPPKRPKKITGTRFATILGLNPWSTDFEIWCAITRTYEEPFEDTIYTAAGKIIEPKQAEYMRTSYGMYNLTTPTDVFGKDYFSKTYGDFFRDIPVLGGMWDYLLVGEDGKPETVLEMKTTKRAEDWLGEIPEYYALQAALYAYLLGVDEVVMVASFLDSEDYERPDAFVPSAENTITRSFRVSERYPDFPLRVQRVMNWWREHVVTGISPDFDEKKDAKILKALRTNSLSPDTDIAAVLAEAESLKDELDARYAELTDKEKRLKQLQDMIREKAKEGFRGEDRYVALSGGKYDWVLSLQTSTEQDKEALSADGLIDKYTKTKTSYRLTAKPKEDK